MERSWLSSVMPSYSGTVSPDRVRTPRWHAPSQMLGSVIPPPIVNSVRFDDTRSPSRQGVLGVQDKTAWQTRRQKQLEGDLQLLLDAQAEGLTAGLEGTVTDDDLGSTGNSTPTAVSSNGRMHTQHPLAASKKPTLREARRGLYTTMRKLAFVKLEETRQLSPNVDECGSALTKIEEWQAKQERLRERTDKIYMGDDQKRADGLRREADEIQPEISELVARLSDLRQRQKNLRKEAEETENRVQAKLSSYTTSLRMLEADINGFLAEPSASIRTSRGLGTSDEFWNLPARQRTLHSAKRAYQDELAVLEQKREAAETEQEALEEGAMVWKDVVKEVSDFEKSIRENIASSGHDPSNDEQGRPSAESNMRDLISVMDQITLQLESKYKLAEARAWRLLICAIGAELDAFKKGRRILTAAMGIVEDGADGALFESPAKDQPAQDDTLVTTAKADPESPVEDRGQTTRKLDFAFGDQPQGHRLCDHTDTDDDGPDPNLLIAKQEDTDTE